MVPGRRLQRSRWRLYRERALLLHVGRVRRLVLPVVCQVQPDRQRPLLRPVRLSGRPPVLQQVIEALLRSQRGVLQGRVHQSLPSGPDRVQGCLLSEGIRVRPLPGPRRRSTSGDMRPEVHWRPDPVRVQLLPVELALSGPGEGDLQALRDGTGGVRQEVL